MMWKLQSVKDSSIVHNLLARRDTSIGRFGTDITITDDPSVSRRHAVLTITFPDSHVGMPACQPAVEIKDESRFGTFVRDKRVTGSVALSHNDVITLGTVNSRFRLIYEPFVITSSCIPKMGKTRIKAVLGELGGHLMSEWRRDCSLLIMSELTVTVKTVCALIQQRPIVKPSYMDALLLYYQNKAPKPDPQSYQPPLNESQLRPDDVKFTPVPERKTLFSGLRFIFLNPTQFHKLSLPVELAGGSARLLEEGAEEEQQDFLTHDNVRVMYADSEDNSLSQNGRQWVQEVQKKLANAASEKKRRMIPEADIGFAVLFASLDMHCNPFIDAPSNVVTHIPSQSLNAATQNLETQSQNKSTDTSTNQNKRKSTSTPEKPPAKKSADDSAFLAPNSLPQGDPTAGYRRLRSSAEGLVPETQLLDQSVGSSEKQKRTARKSIARVERRSPRKRNRRVEDVTTQETGDIPTQDLDNAPSNAAQSRLSPPPAATDGRLSPPQPAAADGRLSPSSADGRVSDRLSPEVKQEPTEWQNSAVKSRPPPKRSTRLDDDDDDDDFPIDFDFGTGSKNKSPIKLEPESRTETRPAGENSSSRSSDQPDAIRPVTPDEAKSRRTSTTPPDGASSPQQYSPQSADFIDMKAQKKIKRDAASDRYYEAGLPQDLASVGEATLVCSRQPRQPAQPAQSRVLWNGRMVDNFKQFKKVGGASRRTDVITDLTEYTAPSNDERDEFVAHQLQVETDRQAADRRAEQLFNWDAQKTSRR